jgi:small-conductance mechanosensitive channel
LTWEIAGQFGLMVLFSGISGVVITLMITAMILHSRKRVASGLVPDIKEFGLDHGLTMKILRYWYIPAILYTLFMGAYWIIKTYITLDGQITHLIFSLFLIPIFIGVDHWCNRLLQMVAGDLPETIDFSEPAPEDTPGETRSALHPGTTPLATYMPLIRKGFRIVLSAFFLFIILRLWGVDLFLGRLFTSHVLSVVIVIVIGLITWEFIKTKIDQKIKEEMPDSDEDMEEGGAGGSRMGTLLLITRKFILVIILVITAMIVLSSLGVNIGPLIAGAGVVGLAIGFGSQALVKDIISGIFFLIDDAFRIGDYIEAGTMKGTVEQISLRSMALRHPRGMVHTIPFGSIESITNFSRDYIITKLNFRVRYDTDVDRVRKIVKKINKKLMKDDEIGPVLLGKVKSQGVREMDDSAMIMRIKFKTIPGEQFIVRKEVFRHLQEQFRENGIEFAHRNVTVYMPDSENEEKKNDKSQIANAAAAALASEHQKESGKGAAS